MKWKLSCLPIAPFVSSVSKFSDNLQSPRWIYALPNGDVLVADDVSNTIWKVTYINTIITAR